MDVLSLSSFSQPNRDITGPLLSSFPEKMLCQWERIRPYDYLVDYEGYVVAHADGACPSIGPAATRGGIGVWYGPDHPL